MFRTCYRVYKYKVLQKGLTNGPVIYQQYINNILFNYLDNFYTIYLDNILIYSKDMLEYELYVQKVLKHLQVVGLQADIKKSEFRVTYTKYLGFIISIDIISIDLLKVEVVKNQQCPMSIKSI